MHRIRAYALTADIVLIRNRKSLRTGWSLIPYWMANMSLERCLGKADLGSLIWDMIWLWKWRLPLKNIILQVMWPEKCRMAIQWQPLPVKKRNFTWTGKKSSFTKQGHWQSFRRFRVLFLSGIILKQIIRPILLWNIWMGTRWKVISENAAVVCRLQLSWKWCSRWYARWRKYINRVWFTGISVLTTLWS